MGFARINIDNKFLALLLGMPKDVKFYNGVPTDKDSLGLVVEHTELRGTIEEIPIIKPIWGKQTTTFNWNQKD